MSTARSRTLVVCYDQLSGQATQCSAGECCSRPPLDLRRRRRKHLLHNSPIRELDAYRRLPSARPLTSILVSFPAGPSSQAVTHMRPPVRLLPLPLRHLRLAYLGRHQRRIVQLARTGQHRGVMRLHVGQARLEERVGEVCVGVCACGQSYSGEPALARGCGGNTAPSDWQLTGIGTGWRGRSRPVDVYALFCAGGRSSYRLYGYSRCGCGYDRGRLGGVGQGGLCRERWCKRFVAHRRRLGLRCRLLDPFHFC